ncbi:hypothetical protein JCM10213v2_001377 [Rhodosporidiobolus nylandii]
MAAPPTGRPTAEELFFHHASPSAILQLPVKKEDFATLTAAVQGLRIAGRNIPNDGMHNPVETLCDSLQRMLGDREAWESVFAIPEIRFLWQVAQRYNPPELILQHPHLIRGGLPSYQVLLVTGIRMAAEKVAVQANGWRDYLKQFHDKILRETPINGMTPMSAALHLRIPPAPPAPHRDEGFEEESLAHGQLGRRAAKIYGMRFAAGAGGGVVGRARRAY